MTEAAVRDSRIGIKEESEFGVDPVIAQADLIELFGDPNFNEEPNIVPRPVVDGSKSNRPGVQTHVITSADLAVEAIGSGTAGTPPDDSVLYKGSWGAENTSTATTTDAGCTTTSIVVQSGDGSNFAVHDLILIDPLGGIAFEVARITDISTDTLTVSPALSSAPGSGVDVGAGVHYKPSTADLISIWIDFWRGDITKEEYSGNKISQFALDFTVGQLVAPKFTFNGKNMGVPVTEACPLAAGSFDSASNNVLVPDTMVIEIDGTSYDLSNLQILMDNTNYQRMGLTTSGIANIRQTSRKLHGSFSLMYEDKSIEDLRRAGTLSETRVVCGVDGVITAGNTLAVMIPKLKILTSSKSVESELYKYDVTFEADYTPGTGEDEGVMSWL